MTVLSARMARWTLMAAAAAAMIALGAPAALAAPPGLAASPGSLPTVSYRGYSFQVPAGWPVIHVARTSATCVTFDRHAIYLGHPGLNQNCPSGLLGTTEAVLVQPSSASSASTSAAEDPVARKITVVGPRVEVTATYDTRRALVARVLASAGLPVPGASAALANGRAGIVRPASSGGHAPVSNAAEQVLAPAAAAAAVPAGAVSYLGPGFDACAAPSAAYMSAWKASSPYGAVGIYIGGSERACAQPNLTASWVAQQAAAGWHFLPTYAGVQAEFDQITAPASQAVAAAQDAVTQAAALGFGPGTAIYYDMEAYPAGQKASVLAFLSAWTTQLHAEGYRSGVYSSSSSGVADLVASFAQDTMPDVIWDALWNGAANAADTVIPAADWANHQRVHQFNGGVSQDYGGDTIDVDQDYLDVNLQPPGPAQPGQAALRTETGQVTDYVIRDRNLYAYYQATPGGGFAGPKKLSGTGDLTGTPVAVQTANGAISVFAATTGGWVRAVWQSAVGGAVTKTARLNGRLSSSPAAVITSQGAIAVYAVGSDGQLYGFEQRKPGGVFIGPTKLTTNGGLTGTPVALPGAAGTVSVYAQSKGGPVRARWQGAAFGAFSHGATLSGRRIVGDFGGVATGTAVSLYGTGASGRQYADRAGANAGSFGGWAAI